MNINIDDILRESISEKNEKAPENKGISKDYMKDQAKDYIKKRLSIIPVGKNKIPLIPWKEFTKRIATPSEVDAWFEKFPEAQLGMVTGEVSGITVVDVEASGGEKEWSKLPQNCPIVKTGGGGRHYWFLYDPTIKNGVKVSGELNDTDIRNNGGYVIIPPSSSDKGSYEWVKQVPPVSFPKSMFSAKSVDIFSSVKSNINNKYYKLLDFYGGEGQGGRNNSMTKYIGYILPKIHPADWDREAWNLVVEANRKNRPPLPESELRNTFESIKQAERLNGEYGNILNEKKWGDEEDDVRLLSEVAKAQEIDLSNPMPLGIEIFDEVIRGGLFPGDLVVIGALPGHGKCHGKGTKILMFDGSIKNVEDIVVGDKIMGDDSTPRTVLSLARGREMLYEIRGKKTEPYVVNQSHILSLEKRVKKGFFEVVNMPVSDFLNLNKWNSNIVYGYKRGVSFKDKKTGLDPYFLGLWLASGNTSSEKILVKDRKVINFLSEYAKKEGYSISEKKEKGGYSVKITGKGFNNKSMIERLGMAKVLSSKFIPNTYKINSRKKRLLLLAGLLDGRGYIKNKVVDIIISSEKLAEDVVYLARSLGFGALFKPVVMRKSKEGKEYDYFRISIWGSGGEIPTKSKSASFEKSENRFNPLRHSIKAIPVGVGDYYGFELDGNNLYLLGDFSVTHNTSFSQHLSYNFVKQNKEKVLFLSYEVLTQFVWEKFKAMGMSDDDVIYAPFKNTTGNLAWVEEKIKEAKEKYGVKVVVIDHMGFLEPSTVKRGENYSLELSRISRELKRISKGEEVIIIVPVHVRKRVSGDRRSITSLDMDDIAHSAGIAQESDLVFLLNREENTDGSTVDIFTNYTLISLAKNRRGAKNPRGFFTLLNERFVYDDGYMGVDNLGKTNYRSPGRTKEDISDELEREHYRSLKEFGFFGDKS